MDLAAQQVELESLTDTERAARAADRAELKALKDREMQIALAMPIESHVPSDDAWTIVHKGTTGFDFSGCSNYYSGITILGPEGKYHTLKLASGLSFLPPWFSPDMLEARECKHIQAAIRAGQLQILPPGQLPDVSTWTAEFRENWFSAALRVSDPRISRYAAKLLSAGDKRRTAFEARAMRLDLEA